jgi:hypothetical protein
MMMRNIDSYIRMAVCFKGHEHRKDLALSRKTDRCIGCFNERTEFLAIQGSNNHHAVCFKATGANVAKSVICNKAVLFLVSWGEDDVFEQIHWQCFHMLLLLLPEVWQHSSLL